MKIIIMIIGLMLSLNAFAQYTGEYQPNKYNCRENENQREWNSAYRECYSEVLHPLISNNPNVREAEEIFRNAYTQCMANHGYYVTS